MKIESKYFKEWINKVTVKGKIPEVKLEFSDNGINFFHNDLSNTILCKGYLKSKIIKQYENIGAIGIGNTLKLLNFLGLFNEEIELTKKDNILLISQKNRKVEYVLSNSDSIAMPMKEPTFTDFEISFDIDANKLKETMKNAKEVSDSIVSINTKEKQLLITAGEQDKFIDKFDIPQIQKEGISVIFGEPLKDVLDVLDGNINISLATNAPMKIIAKSELYELVYWIAPRDESGENNEE